SRPMPRPPPVTITTRPSQSLAILDPLENMNRAGAAGADDMREPDARIFHLPRAGFATQMRRNFVDIGDAGRAERMAFRQEPARDVHGNTSAMSRLTCVDQPAGFAFAAEPEVFVVHELGRREAIMQLEEV